MKYKSIPEEAIKLLDQGKGTDAIVDAKIKTAFGTNVSPRTARRWRETYMTHKKEKHGEDYAPPSEIVYRDVEGPHDPIFEEDGTQATAFVSGKRITTVDELVEACEVDLELWEPVGGRVKTWEMGRKATVKDLQFTDGKISGLSKDTGQINTKTMVSIELRFVVRKERPFELAIESLVERLKDYAPEYSAPAFNKLSDAYAWVPCIYDWHINKRSVDETWTLEEAEKVFRKTCDALIAKTVAMQWPIERIPFVIGQDAFHTDNKNGTTTKGTAMDIVGNHVNAIDAAIRSYTYALENLAKVAKVDVVVMPGNHDNISAYWLGKVLQAHFRKHTNIKFNIRSDPFQYYLFGSTMLGFTHGSNRVDPAKLSSIILREAIKYKADIEYIVWLRGHLHKKAHAYYPVDEYAGVSFEFIPALCPTDNWHEAHGFIGNHRAARSLFYHSSEGPAGAFDVFVKELAV